MIISKVKKHLKACSDLKIYLPQGTWTKEPDLAMWDYNRVNCLILRHPDLGTLNGYAQVLDDHPWYNKDICDNIFSDVHIHGGITFSGTLAIMGQDWYVGFDCAHYCDFVPGYQVITTSIQDTLKYRDLRYVQKEIELLVHHILSAKN